MVRFELHLDHVERNEEEEDESEDEEEVEEVDELYEEEEIEEDVFPSSSPDVDAGDDVSTASSSGVSDGRSRRRNHQFSLTSVVAAALRKSLVMCSAGVGDDEGCRPVPSVETMEISWPTNVRHVAHVTFDRFSGFLGLPVELEPELPGRVPSASVSVFGVSAESMQCSYDKRGNSVPSILLSMQRHLYLQGGLQMEGIFRITAENSQELFVRDQLNHGIVPQDVVSHCLAGLIKAWFRELPRGVLDSLTPDQVMHCNSEEECTVLVRMLPQTEAALLDWAINLMADVVEHEHYNKMNARNIAMVFAPNMTQMADPLTALIHAVQVMNFLKTLIMKTLQEREEAVAASRLLDTCSESPSDKDESELSKPMLPLSPCANENSPDFALDKFLFSSASTLESDTEGRNSKRFDDKSDTDENHKFISQSPPQVCEFHPSEAKHKDEFVHEDHLDTALSRTTFRKGMWKLCRHPVFQLSRSSKKLTDISILGSREVEREAWT